MPIDHYYRVGAEFWSQSIYATMICLNKENWTVVANKAKVVRRNKLIFYMDITFCILYFVGRSSHDNKSPRQDEYIKNDWGEKEAEKKKTHLTIKLSDAMPYDPSLCSQFNCHLHICFRICSTSCSHLRFSWMYKNAAKPERFAQ